MIARSLKIFFATVALTAITNAPTAAADSEKPNILWLVQEDLSPWIACYGHEIQEGHTPTIDGMAARGVRFSRAYVPFPVCSTCRSSFIVGANAIRFGAHEHRSRRGKAALPLPDGIKTLPELMSDAGYFCFCLGKTDYNFAHGEIYSDVGKKNKSPWKSRKEGQPFFGQIQLKGGKLNTTKFQPKTDPAKVTVPGDYPQNQLFREVVAEHYDSARMDDGIIGKILEQLKADGLGDSTIVVYFSDHGANNLVRHKQQPTEAGLHVPLVIEGPEKWVPNKGVVRNELMSILDISATTVAWAGLPKPSWFEGQDLFGKDYKPADHICCARDRCDQTIERIRTVRTDKYRFTRNYLLDRVLLQPQYRDARPFVVDIRKAYADGTLAPHLAKIYFGERPAEELYDVEKDPAQVHNLIDDPQYAGEVARHRKLLDAWIAKGDMGAGLESELELKINGEGTKWGEGVNVEYEAIREDSDGDGLSDKWEKLSGRDPDDGKLQFLFDQGGWQTEGWTTKDDIGNIAGSQGFLDFALTSGKGKISRSGLKADATKNSSFTLAVRSNHETKVTFSINGTPQAPVTLASSESFAEIRMSPSQQTGEINSLDLEFSADAGTTVEIDWIKAN